MRALDRLSEGDGDGDEPQPETPGGASGASCATGCDVKAAAGFPGDPLRVNVRRRRRRCDAGTPEMRERMARARAAQDPDALKKHPWRRGLSKIEARLTPEHRREYEDLLRDKFETLGDAKKWLDEHGYNDIGMHAIVSHRHHFDDALLELRQAARFAANLRHLFGKHGPTAMSDVTLTRMQQVLTERLFRTGPRGGGAMELEIGQLVLLSKMVESAIGARQRLEQIRHDFEEVRKLVTRKGERMARSGADGQLVVNRVKQLLGVPLGPETPEEAAAADRQSVPFDLAELEKPSPEHDSDPKT